MSTFQSPTDVLPLTKVLSASLNNLDAAVATAFGLLPTEANLTRGTVNYAVDTGAVNAYVVALPHTPSGFVDGLQVDFRPLATNTGTSTINVSALGVKSIRNASGTALAAGDLTVGIPATLRYSTATGFFHVAPNSAVSATAAAASAAAALVSQNAAAASSSSASTSATTAATSATNAAASATLSSRDITHGTSGISHIILGELGIINLFSGDAAAGPGGNAFDGGILTQSLSGAYQVSSYQLTPTSNVLKPEWGPIAEIVVQRTSDQINNFQRISLTAMSDWAGPALNDVATDYRIQQEARGTAPLLPIKFTSQQNNTGAYMEYLTLLPSGDIQAFRRYDVPGNQLEFFLETEKRATVNVLTAAGMQDSPAFRMTGKSYDTSLHDADWRMFTAVRDTAGASSLVVQTRKDAAAYTEILDIIDSGTIGVYGSIAIGTSNPGVNSYLAFNAINTGVFGTVPINSASMIVKDKAPGTAAWKARGENGFEGWVMLLNATPSIGTDTVGTNVFSTTSAALGANAGFIVTENPTGGVIYIPYWSAV